MLNVNVRKYSHPVSNSFCPCWHATNDPFCNVQLNNVHDFSGLEPYNSIEYKRSVAHIYLLHKSFISFSGLFHKCKSSFFFVQEINLSW